MSSHVEIDGNGNRQSQSAGRTDDRKRALASERRKREAGRKRLTSEADTIENIERRERDTRKPGAKAEQRGNSSHE
ncbi:hypothetical protein R1flu_005451 [Riccia fluitans]|uniref:Small EDRK-rich factor-like N-terminal domain-containing protein n=1 Tax=Riccia fluitans TaxID=41844 RepID=A0ABD1YW63_9MARC